MKQYLMLRFVFTVWLTSLLMTALGGMEVQGQTQTATGPSQIVITTTPSSDAVTVQLTIPADVQLDTLSMKLNGNDLSRSFTTVSCPQGICQQATFTSLEGLHDSKNVFSAMGKRNNGTLVSARTRFVGAIATSNAHALIAGARAVHANAVGALPTLSSFLPPAIAFKTLTFGGYASNKAWIQIGTQNTYPANPASYTCSGIYTAIVLDRQTLQEKTASPELSPKCVSDGGALKTYLATLNSSDLVIVGSNFGDNSDAGTGFGQLDTSAIGGTAYNCPALNDCNKLPSTTVTSSDVPQGYMAIGVGGAASGSAYENYYNPNPTWFTLDPHATGTLVEDVNGNYNFQTGTAIEYTVYPRDLNFNNFPDLYINTIPGDPYSTSGIQVKLYSVPTLSTYQGMWMLKLQRSTLFSIPFDVPGPPPSPVQKDACPQSALSQDGKTAYFLGCGQYYDTGNSDPTVSSAAYTSLMADLQDVDPSELVFLVSAGYQPGYPDTNGHKLIPSGLADAFSVMGGAPETLTNLNPFGSAYSYVGCIGCGNALGGNVVVSTNLQSQQGQTGYIHGLLQPNLKGMYWHHSSCAEHIRPSSLLLLLLSLLGAPQEREIYVR